MTVTSRRVLILTADAGLGHRSAAEAIATALQRQYGDACVLNTVNVFAQESVPDFARERGADYDQIVQEMPALYRLGYNLSDGIVMTTVLRGFLTMLLAETMDKLVEQYAPDVVVSTYPAYQAVLDAERPRVPYLTVVTDFTAIHEIWFSPHVDLCVVPTEVAREQAVEAGLPAERVEVMGIPVDPAFGEARAPALLRSSLGWNPDLTTVLAVGGKRVGNLPDIVRVLNHAGFPIQLALVAGQNEDLHREFKEMDWHLPAHIYGFVDNMPTLMHASDLILCKAGGLIVSESLAAGLPLLLVDVLPGQEAGNAEFVVQGEAGVLAQDPLQALETLAHWLEHDEARLRQCTQNARRLGNSQAAFEVADRIWDLCTSG